MASAGAIRSPSPPAQAIARESGMHFGGAMFFTDYSMPAPELARALEERGFESVWAPEHSHIPLSRKTPFPGGGELPKAYYDAMDPFVVLAAASEATRRIKLGTGVALIQQRDVIQTAKLVAPIDQGEPGTGPVWGRRRLEPGRNGRPRHRLCDPLQAGARIDRGDEGNLDEGEGGISRGVREFRPDDRPAQTGPETASANSCRRRFPAWRTARHPLWRWLDSRWRYPRGLAGIPRH